MRNLKEPLSNNVFISNGDEQIQSISQTDVFLNMTNVLFPGETNDVLANFFSNDTEQAFTYTMDEFPILNGQFEDILDYQLL